MVSLLVLLLVLCVTGSSIPFDRVAAPDSIRCLDRVTFYNLHPPVGAARQKLNHEAHLEEHRRT